MTREMAEACAADYAKFEFHLVAQRLQTFCSEDLGGFWLDILKDRLYTARKDSRARRSAQSALHHVTQMLLRLMAPILSFTGRGGWEVLHPGKDESVFFHTWNDVLPPQEGEAELVARWKRMRELRAVVTKRLEDSRAAGAIGSSLQAEVAVACTARTWSCSRRSATTSSSSSSPRRPRREGVRGRASRYAERHAKCERCWHWRADVGADRATPRSAPAASPTSRARRGAHACLRPRTAWMRWLALSARSCRRPRDQGVDQRAFRYGEVARVLPFFNLVLVHNTGAAFSFLAGAGGWQRWFFTAVAIAISPCIVVMLRQPGNRRSSPSRSPWCWAARSATSTTA
jgi:hypothetical protein